MATSTVYDAFKARLVTLLGGTYAIRDWEEIEVALQQGATPWLVMEDSGAEQELTSIGTPQQNWAEDQGFIDVHCMVPIDNGLGPARTAGEAVRSIMQFYDFTGLPVGETLRVMTVSSPEPGLIHSGLWHSMLVTISYVHRYTAATAVA